jgi:DNA repair exonuclease SbcCD ATPase subunit
MEAEKLERSTHEWEGKLRDFEEQLRALQADLDDAQKLRSQTAVAAFAGDEEAKHARAEAIERLRRAELEIEDCEEAIAEARSRVELLRREKDAADVAHVQAEVLKLGETRGSIAAEIEAHVGEILALADRAQSIEETQRARLEQVGRPTEPQVRRNVAAFLLWKLRPVLGGAPLPHPALRKPLTDLEAEACRLRQPTEREVQP